MSNNTNSKKINEHNTISELNKIEIQINYLDLAPDPIKGKQSIKEPFMGLEELFWQCYAIKAKHQSPL